MRWSRALSSQPPETTFNPRQSSEPTSSRKRRAFWTARGKIGQGLQRAGHRLALRRGRKEFTAVDGVQQTGLCRHPGDFLCREDFDLTVGHKGGSAEQMIFTSFLQRHGPCGHRAFIARFRSRFDGDLQMVLRRSRQQNLRSPKCFSTSRAADKTSSHAAIGNQSGRNVTVTFRGKFSRAGQDFALARHGLRGRNPSAAHFVLVCPACLRLVGTTPPSVE